MSRYRKKLHYKINGYYILKTARTWWWTNSERLVKDTKVSKPRMELWTGYSTKVFKWGHESNVDDAIEKFKMAAIDNRVCAYNGEL